MTIIVQLGVLNKLILATLSAPKSGIFVYCKDASVAQQYCIVAFKEYMDRG